MAPHLSIVIPAYNEERRLPATLVDYVAYLSSRGFAYEVIVVNDGSSDRTKEVVENFSKLNPAVRLINLERNQGKGNAVKTGALSAEGELVLFADADGATPIAELKRLEDGILAGADVAIGSRAKKAEDTAVRTKLFLKIRGQTFNRIVNALLLPSIRDTQCGFKLFKRECAKFCFERQRSKGFSFDVEILYIAQQAGFAIAEIPINWTNIPGSKVHPILDPLRMLRDVIWVWFIHRNAHLR